MSPLRPVLVVPLSIWDPLLIVREPVVIEMLPPGPHGPEQDAALPIVEVKIPLASGCPSPKIGSPRARSSPEIETLSALIVTLPPRPLVLVTVLIRAPSVSSSLGVVMKIVPAFPNGPLAPKELLNMPVGLELPRFPNRPR